MAVDFSKLDFFKRELEDLTYPSKRRERPPEAFSKASKQRPGSVTLALHARTAMPNLTECRKLNIAVRDPEEMRTSPFLMKNST